MSLLRVSLFGRFEVRSKEEVLTGFEARKAQELFCYLLLYQEYPHSRESLAHLLWDEHQTDRPSRCLRKALCQLRSALDSQGEPLSHHVLQVGSDRVQIDPQADLWLDVAQFRQSFDRVQHLEGSELGSQHLQALLAAVRLYRGVCKKAGIRAGIWSSASGSNTCTWSSWTN